MIAFIVKHNKFIHGNLGMCCTNCNTIAKMAAFEFYENRTSDLTNDFLTGMVSITTIF